MGGEDQVKALIRQAFSLQNTADRVVLDVDELLGQVMLNVKQLVELLPDENLLKLKAWRELEPIIKIEMEPYARGLYGALQQENGAAVPDMAAYAEREAGFAGVKNLKEPAPPNVQALVNNAKVAGTEG